MTFWYHSKSKQRVLISQRSYFTICTFLNFFLQSHKAVSRRKQGDFGKWHSKWLKSHVAESSQTSINEWFMGKCDGLVANKTHKVTKADLESTPYRTFYKYKAEIVKTSSVMSTNGPSSTNPTTNPDDESPSENWDFDNEQSSLVCDTLHMIDRWCVGLFGPLKWPSISLSVQDIITSPLFVSLFIF